MVSTGAGWSGTGRGMDSTGLLGVTDGGVVALSDSGGAASLEPDDGATDCDAVIGGVVSAATDGNNDERPMIVPYNTTAATALEMLNKTCRRRCGGRGVIGTTAGGRGRHLRSLPAPHPARPRAWGGCSRLCDI